MAPAHTKKLEETYTVDTSTVRMPSPSHQQELLHVNFPNYPLLHDSVTKAPARYTLPLGVMLAYTDIQQSVCVWGLLLTQ